MKFREIGINKINEIIKDDNKSFIIEKSIYNACVEHALFRGIEIGDNYSFKLLYVNKIRSIYVNLDPNSYLKNVNFLNNIKNNNIQCEDIGNLKPEEIFPEKWKKIKDKQIAYNDFLCQKTESTITDDYKCGRCKQRKCTSYDLQTRSADEPMTTFITCLNCGNHWSF